MKWKIATTKYIVIPSYRDLKIPSIFHMYAINGITNVENHCAQCEITILSLRCPFCSRSIYPKQIISSSLYTVYEFIEMTSKKEWNRARWGEQVILSLLPMADQKACVSSNPNSTHIHTNGQTLRPISPIYNALNIQICVFSCTIIVNIDVER